MLRSRLALELKPRGCSLPTVLPSLSLPPSFNLSVNLATLASFHLSHDLITYVCTILFLFLSVISRRPSRETKEANEATFEAHFMEMELVMDPLSFLI